MVVPRLTFSSVNFIHTWGKMKQGVNLARMDDRLSGAEVENTELQIENQVRKLYYSLSFARTAEDKMKQVEQLLQQRDDSSLPDSGHLRRGAFQQYCHSRQLPQSQQDWDPPGLRQRRAHHRLWHRILPGFRHSGNEHIERIHSRLLLRGQC